MVAGTSRNGAEQWRSPACYRRRRRRRTGGRLRDACCGPSALGSVGCRKVPGTSDGPAAPRRCARPRLGRRLEQIARESHQQGPGETAARSGGSRCASQRIPMLCRGPAGTRRCVAKAQDHRRKPRLPRLRPCPDFNLAGAVALCRAAPGVSSSPRESWRQPPTSLDCEHVAGVLSVMYMTDLVTLTD